MEGGEGKGKDSRDGNENTMTSTFINVRKDITIGMKEILN